MTKLLKIITISCAMATSATAGDFVLGVGVGHVADEGSSGPATLTLEYHSDPLFERGRLSAGWSVVAQVNEDNDLFIGGGAAAEYALSERWFFEASLMPGYFGKGSGSTDLGGNIQFRTVVGLGYNLTETSAISIAIDHKSNAGIEDVNPGTEALKIRFIKRF